jgi:signal transduction histidine kinase/ActR/RegA family two-component response regulator
MMEYNHSGESDCLGYLENIQNKDITNEELEEFISCLRGEFTSVYKIDLEKDTYKVLQTNGQVFVDVEEMGDYTKTNETSLSNFVDKDYMEARIAIGRPDNLRKSLAKDNRIELEFRLAVPNHPWIRATYYCVERKDGVPVKVIMAHTYIDKIRAERLEYEIEQREIVKREKKLTGNARQFRQAMISDAVAFYEFNVTKDVVYGTDVHIFTDEDISLPGEVGTDSSYSFTELTNEWAESKVKSDREAFCEFFSKEHLLECYANGECEPWYEYWTTDVLDNIICVRQSFLLTKEEETGDIVAFTVIKDITEQKNKEEEFYRQIEMIEGLGEEFASVYFGNMRNDEITPYRVSKLMTNLFGIKAHEISSYHEVFDEYINQCVYGEDKEMMLKFCTHDSICTQLRNQSVISMNYRALIDGEIEYYQIKVVKVGHSEAVKEVVIGVRSVDEQIREAMKQQAELEKALKEAEKANVAKSLFLSNMSHDIRTPMNAIIGFTTLALSSLDEKEQLKSYLENILTSGTHLLNLINDVLDMSSIESGKIRLSKKSVNLVKLMQYIQRVVELQADEKNSHFSVELVDIKNKNVYCDKLRLSQVLINLLSNAIKYTDSGGEILLRTTQVESGIAGYATYEFMVKDNGIGISEEFKGRMFDSFERERNSTISGIQGTGLGLAIVKRLVEKMDGTIQVESKLGEGSTFTVTVSFEIAGEIENLSEGEEGCADKDIEEISMSGRRILLVDDNVLNRSIAKKLLNRNEIEVDEAVDGEMAVSQLEKSQPGFYSAVLMDIQMPVMNGYEATKIIRQLQRQDLANIPIIAMTANAFESDKQMAQEAGMDGYIVKPFNIKIVIETLKRTIGKKKK